MQDKQLQIVITAKNEATKTLENLSDSLKKNEGNFKNLSLASGIAFGAIAGGVGLAVKKAGEMESIEIAFSTMLKSAEGAKTMIKELNDFAAKTPYEFDEIARASKSLLSFGVPAKEMQDELRRIGDIASGIGAPIGEIAELYGKAKVQGRLYGEDINQLTGRGIPIIGQLAKQFGVAESEVKKLVEQGKIGFPQLQRAFQDMTSNGGQFENMMQAQSESFNGLMSTLKDNISQTLVVVGSQFLPVLKNLIHTITPILEKIKEWVQENPKLTTAIVIISGAITGLVFGFSLLALALPPIIAGFTSLGITMGVLQTTILPITGIIAGIVAIIYTANESIKIWQNDSGLVIAGVKAYWSDFSTFFKKIWDNIKSYWKDVWEGIKIIVKDASSSIVGFFQPFIDSVTSAYNWVVKLIEKMKELGGDAVSKVSGFFGGNRATGGGVQSGQSYMVGEKGPEMFTPASNGSITPNYKMAGAGGMNLTINMNGGTYLSETVAEDIGDMMISSLRKVIKF